MGTLDDLERRAYTDALDKTNGNRVHAAKLLGVHVATVKRRMIALGLRERFPEQPGRRKRSKSARKTKAK